MPSRSVPVYLSLESPCNRNHGTRRLCMRSESNHAKYPKRYILHFTRPRRVVSPAETTVVLGTLGFEAIVIMRKTQPRESLVYNVRSWAEEIPLGSLDQLQQVAGRSRLLRGDVDNPASIPLPVSRDSPSQNTGSEDSRREQLSEHSLLDAQNQLHLLTAEALGVLLPESNGLGNDKSSPGGISIVDSLAQLQTARVSTSTKQSAGQPTEQPTEQPTSRPTPRPTPRPTNQNYWENIKPLTQILPHLKAIQPPNGRHQRVGRLKSIDYFNNGMAPQLGISLEISAQSDRDQLVTELQNLKIAHENVASRMIIAEDLCSELIGALGLAFDLDPEFFAEHLNRSGYHEFDYEDSPPTRWNTAQLQKSCCRLRELSWTRRRRLQTAKK
jgi:hypothetical protein